MERRRVPYGEGRERWAIKCCGQWLLCAGFTNTCGECYTDYNMSGQVLAPREQWGEETGESVSDILAADYDHD